MLKSFLICLIASFVNAGQLLNGGALGGLTDGNGLNARLELANAYTYNHRSYGPGLTLSRRYGANSGPITAAIQSYRTYEVKPLALPQERAVPQTIEVEPSEQPVTVIFRSISSPVQVQQIHTAGAPGQVEHTNSEDEPHRVVHEVLRPVIQEVREVIQPYRRVVQEVRPVVEEIHTVVAKGEQRQHSSLVPKVQYSIVSESQSSKGYATYKKGAKAA